MEGVLIVVDRERQRAGLHPNIARREREAFTEAREDDRLADRLRHAGCAVARDRVADPFALCDVRARLEIEAGAREPDAVFASKGLFGIEECLQRSEIERRERKVRSEEHTTELQSLM